MASKKKTKRKTRGLSGVSCSRASKNAAADKYARLETALDMVRWGRGSKVSAKKAEALNDLAKKVFRDPCTHPKDAQYARRIFDKTEA